MEALWTFVETMGVKLVGMALILFISGGFGYAMGREGERKRWIKRRAEAETKKYRVSARIKEDKRGRFHVALGKLERDDDGKPKRLNVDWVTSIGDTFDSPSAAEKRIKAYWPDAFVVDESEIKRNFDKAERLAEELSKLH